MNLIEKFLWSLPNRIVPNANRRAGQQAPRGFIDDLLEGLLDINLTPCQSEEQTQATPFAVNTWICDGGGELMFENSTSPASHPAADAWLKRPRQSPDRDANRP